MKLNYIRSLPQKESDVPDMALKIAEFLRGARQAVELIEQLQAENERLKASQRVRCGEWLNFANDFSTAECDKCGEVYEVSPDEESCEDYFKAFKQFYNFCPNCGADMRKEN